MKALFFVFAILISMNVSANIIPLKGGDTAMVIHPEDPQSYQEVYVVYVEDGMARIRAKKNTKSDVFDEFWLATLPVESLVHPVQALGNFKQGDTVCLNKKIKSFRKGFCSRIHVLYENGYAVLWKGLFSSDVLVTIQDIEHKN